MDIITALILGAILQVPLNEILGKFGLGPYPWWQLGALLAIVSWLALILFAGRRR